MWIYGIYLLIPSCIRSNCGSLGTCILHAGGEKVLGGQRSRPKEKSLDGGKGDPPRWAVSSNSDQFFAELINVCLLLLDSEIIVVHSNCYFSLEKGPDALDWLLDSDDVKVWSPPTWRSQAFFPSLRTDPEERQPHLSRALFHTIPMENRSAPNIWADDSLGDSCDQQLSLKQNHLTRELLVCPWWQGAEKTFGTLKNLRIRV